MSISTFDTQNISIKFQKYKKSVYIVLLKALTQRPRKM